MVSESGWASTLDQLHTHLGGTACPHLEQARRFSLERLAALRAVIERHVGEPVQAHQRGWLVTGSLGRLEALAASDVDLTMVCPAGVDPHDAANVQLDREVRDALRDGLGVGVSRGEHFTSPTAADQIASPGCIGGGGDDVTKLTKRVLLITESRPLVNTAAHSELRRRVFGAYFESSKTKGRALRPLENDVVRYYRTVCVDYKARVDAYGRPWAPRNLKLRHTRKYWFFASMLALVYASVCFEADSTGAEQTAAELLEATPTERLVRALAHCGLRDGFAVVGHYDRFIGEIGRPEVRQALDRLEYDQRYESEVFRGLHENARRLHEALLEVIDALPVAWRRHIFGHFLL